MMGSVWERLGSLGEFSSTLKKFSVVSRGKSFLGHLTETMFIRFKVRGCAVLFLTFHIHKPSMCIGF